LKPSSKTPSTNTYAVPDEDFLSSDDEDYSVMETDRPLPPQMTANQPIDLTLGDDVSANPIPLAGIASDIISSGVTLVNVHSNIIDLTSEPDMDVASDLGNDNTYGDISDGDPSEDGLSVLDDESSRSSSPYDYDMSPVRGYTRSPSIAGCDSQVESDSESDSAEENSEIDLSNADARIIFSDDEADADADPDAELLSDDERVDADADIDLDADGESVDVPIVDEYTTTDDFDGGDGTSKWDNDSQGITHTSHVNRYADLHNMSYFGDDISSDSDSEVDTSILDKHPAAAIDSPATSPPTAPPAKMAADLNFPVPTTASISAVSMPKVWGVPTYQGYTASRDRQPSPSDAAMVKNHPLFGHPLFANPAKSTAQALGERTGNFDFWAARDHNRAIAMSNPLVSAVRATLVAEQSSDDTANGVTETAPSSAPSVQVVEQLVEEKGFSNLDPASRNEPAHPAPESWNEPKPTKTSLPPRSNPEEELAQYQSATSPLLTKSAWTASGEAFLNQPPQCSFQWLEERTRLQSPEPDMTSASTFKESKEESQNKASQTVRRLPIEDLLAQESKEATPAANEVNNTPAVEQVTPVRSLKRSFDAVFNNAAEEAVSVENHPTPTRRAILQRYTRPDGSHAFRPARFDGPIVINTSVAVEPKAPNDEEEIAAVLTSTQHSLPIKPDTPVQYQDFRPVKRRRFAQVAACALGTVLGGAAVLAGMIATAPSI
jgi:hypothetical protein